MDRIAGLVEVNALYAVDARDETVAAGSLVDIGDLADNLVVLLDSEAGFGTTPTLDLVIQHRADADDSWANVPAAAL
ncbi:MAG: hypothetical protein GY851_07170, partial [bacterium]|nr:hypothetical protein [bacterium]